MRILIHTSQLLYPSDGGGKIRSAHLFEALARTHEVTVAVFRRPCDDAGAVERMRRCAARVVAIDWDEPMPPSARFYAGVARAGCSRLPFGVRKVHHAGMQRAIAGLVADWRPELIVCDFVQNAINLPLGAVPAVLSAHNVEATIIDRLADHVPGRLARAYLRLEAAKLRRFEAHAARRFDRVIVVSDDDHDTFTRDYQVSAAVVAPNGVDLARFRPAPDAGGRDVVFVGCLDWSPNADAVTHYVERILPRVRRRGASRFWIVGRNPPPAVRALADRHPDVTVTGTVADVRPYLERAAVVVVPLRVGGGTRIKILEAMACGRAVVSTTVGAEGLVVEDGRHLVRADEPADFADRVATLLDAPALRARLAREGRRLVEDRYSWDASARIFTAACEDAVSPRSGAARVAARR